MRAFGFDAGTAKIKYSWGQNPKKCAAHKAAVKKEKKDKFDLRQQLKKKLRESEYKAAIKALQGSTTGCKGASKWLAVVKIMLSKRKLEHLTNVKKVAQCKKEKAKLKAELKKLAQKAKVKQDLKKDYKHKEKNRKFRL